MGRTQPQGLTSLSIGPGGSYHPHGGQNQNQQVKGETMRRKNQYITWQHHSMIYYHTWQIIAAILLASGAAVAVVLAVLP